MTVSSPTDLARLESHLWEAASILRGSPVDRADWKSYILPLLFFKRICEVCDEEQAAMRRWKTNAMGRVSHAQECLLRCQGKPATPPPLGTRGLTRQRMGAK